MKHYNFAEWSEYIGGQLSNVAQNELETHLYGCDACLEVYMDCLAQHETQPAEGLSEPDYLEAAWIDQIMSKIEKRKPFSPPRRVALYRKPVFQYAMAAAITIILMVTGIFQGITGKLDQQPTATKQMLEVSYTDKIMDKTVAILDTIQLKAKLIEKGEVNHE